MDSEAYSHLWTEFDSVMHDTLTQILGAPLSDLQWMQSQLPVSLGGAGLRGAVQHAPAAYLISLLSSKPLKDGLLQNVTIDFTVGPALSLLNQQTSDNDTRDSLFRLQSSAECPEPED